ncbi:MAG: NAD(P)-dependent oxidoreductase, partial [Gemmatimonadaceae bacterium]
VTLRAYAEAVASWAGEPAVLDFLPWDEWQSGQSEQSVMLTRDHMLHSPGASIAKAERVLGFRPRFDAVSAVRDALGR